MTFESMFSFMYEYRHQYEIFAWLIYKEILLEHVFLDPMTVNFPTPSFKDDLNSQKLMKQRPNDHEFRDTLFRNGTYDKYLTIPGMDDLSCHCVVEKAKC